MAKLNIPLNVPKYKQKEYRNNWRLATKGTGRLMLFAGDQKVEHLNDDFFGKNIDKEDANPKHLFEIAATAHIGVFASQLGLISRYGQNYPQIPYLIKLNARTNLVKTKNPVSRAWISVADVVRFKQQSKLNVVGVGYTIYIGSEYEAEMLKEAAQIVLQAQQQGLLSVIWMYPRGAKVLNEDDTHLIAGGAGVANCLGADFVKVKYPYKEKGKQIAKNFQEVIEAAGNTGVICVGGSQKTPKDYLKLVEQQVQVSGTRGVAVGRNLHQRSLKEAVRLANALSSIILYDYNYKDALAIYDGKKKMKW